MDAEDSAVLVNHPSYARTYVYGNVLIEHEGDGNSQIVHYGGDSGTINDYRKGILHFFHNTIVSTRTGNTTLLRLSTNEESADVRNNVLYVTAGGARLAMLAETGHVWLRNNWARPGWVASHSGGATGTVEDDGTFVTAASPGFVDEAGQDYRLAEGSTAIDGGGPIAAELLVDHSVARQYVVHQRAEPRPMVGAPDIGAFEYCGPGECDPPPIDAGVDDDAGVRLDGSVPTDGGAPRDGGTTPGGDAGAPAEEEGGCGCVMAGRGPNDAAPLALVALVALALRRVRRRRPR